MKKDMDKTTVPFVVETERSSIVGVGRPLSISQLHFRPHVSRFCI